MIIPIESDGTLGAFAMNGVPWQRVLTSDVVEVLCAFFAAREIPGTAVDRGCQVKGAIDRDGGVRFPARDIRVC